MKLCIFHGGGGENTMTGEGNFRSAFMNDGTCTVLVGETKISTGKQTTETRRETNLAGTNFPCGTSFYFGGALFQSGRYWGVWGIT